MSPKRIIEHAVVSVLKHVFLSCVFQALEWLQANYWDEQEQVLLETRTILKSKLVEHAGVVLNIFPIRQLLASEEGKGEDSKQKIRALRRSRKGEISRG